MTYWWNDYVGVPYTPKGRSRDGADCWGLVRLVYKDQFDIDLPAFSEEYEADDVLRINDMLAMHREGWERVEQPQAGDVVLFRMFGHLGHVGLAAAPGTFLHCRDGYSATVERLDAGQWKHRVEGFYRYKPKADELSVGAMPHPLRTERFDGVMPAGMTLQEIADEITSKANIPAAINSKLLMLVDGKIVPRERWDMIPANGARVEYRAVAAGSVGRALLTLAVIVVAAIVAPALLGFGFGAAGTTAAVAAGYGTALSVATAGLTIAGSLLVNAIFPVRPPSTPNTSADSGPARQNLLSGGQNQAAPYSAIPVVLGTYRYVAPLAAQNYVESSTTDSYLRQALVWGYGPLQVADLRIGGDTIDTFEEVEYETLEGVTGESTTRFNSLYGKDVEQQYVNIQLDAVSRAVSSATRTSNVVTVVTTTAHTASTGWFYGSQSITVVNSTTFTYPSTGANGAVAITSVVLSPFTERVINEECNKIRVELHFPEGLRMMATSESISGNTYATPFRAVIQSRQLDSTTLAPLTSWGNIEKTIKSSEFKLQKAWLSFGRAAQKCYRWYTISVDQYSVARIRSGSLTNNQYADPSGSFLTRLKDTTRGLNTTYTRLATIPNDEQVLWYVCVYGDSVAVTTDGRPGTVTGCALTTSGLTATLASGTIDRAETVTVNIGATGEEFANRKDAFTYVVSFDVPNGIHEVRVRRTNDSEKETTIGAAKAIRYHTCYFLTATGYSTRRPILPPKPLAMTSVRVKASNQISGNLEGVSATVSSIAKDWDSATSTWITRPTNNPASLFRLILQHPANAQAAADSKIDLTALQEWHEYCDDNDFSYNNIITEQRSLIEVLRDVAAAGRASPTLRDGKWSVVIDKPRTVVAQYFTPHNSWGFEGVRALPVLPHGFRVQFANSERAYQSDEMIVYNDGYSSSNATILEGLQLPGVTEREAIYKHARFHLAQLKLRPETYTLYADIEHLICTRGDLVRVTHDVPLWGLGSGRIKERVSGTVLKLDEPVPMDAGQQYTIRIRLEDGSSVTRTVAAAATDGYYSTITLTTSVTTTQAPVGGLFMFGALNSETVELIVLAIEPAENMTARLTLVDYSPEVYDSDTETIPAFDSQITLPLTLQQQAITVAPTVSATVSDESVMQVLGPGKYGYQIRVAYTNPTTLPTAVKYVEGQISATDDTAKEWRPVPAVKMTAGNVYFGDVDEGGSYDIRIRYADEFGRVGPWATVSNHTVVGKTTPPSQVGAVTASVKDQKVLLDWPDAPEPDVVAYEVRLSDSGWGDSSRLFKGNVSSCLVEPAASGTARTWYIKAIDAGGLYSTLARSVSYTLGAPANPTTITASFSDTALTNSTITLDWTDVSPTAGLNYYIVQYSTTTKTVKASTITLPADWVGSRVFTVKTVDLLGNQSTGSSITVTKLGPNPVTNLRAQVIDNNVLLYWDLPAKTTLPIQNVELRKGATWASATVIGTKAGGFTALQETQAGVYTYWVAVNDTDNNQSSPVSVAVNVADPPDFVFHGDFTSSFTGTKSSAIVEAGEVVIPVNTTETFAQHFTNRSWTSPSDQIAAGYPIFIQPTPSSGYYEEVFDFGAELSSSRVTVTYTGETIAGTPTLSWTTSVSQDNVTYTQIGTTDAFGTDFRYVKVRLTVSDATLKAVYRLTSLKVRLDAKLINDAGTVSAVSTDTSGTVANFNKTFVDVTAVTVSASGTTPVTAIYNFQDARIAGTYSVTSNVCTVSATAHDLVVGQNVRLSVSTGGGVDGVYTVASVPTANSFTVAMTTANTSGNVSMYPQGIRVYLFNSAGTRVSGTVSWSIKGY